MLIDFHQPIEHVIRGRLARFQGNARDPADHIARKDVLRGAAVTGWDDDQTGMDILAPIHGAEVGRVVGDQDEPLALNELPQRGVADSQDAPVAVAGPFEPQLVSYLYERW